MYKYLYKIPLLGINILVITILLNFALEVMTKQDMPTPITISLNNIKSLNTCTFHISGQFLRYCFVLFGFLLNIFIKGFSQFVTEIEYYFNQINEQAFKNTIIGLLYINCIIFLVLITYKEVMYIFNLISLNNKNENTKDLIEIQNNVEHEYEIDSTNSIFSDEYIEQHISNINKIDIKTTDSNINIDVSTQKIPNPSITIEENIHNQVTEESELKEETTTDDVNEIVDEIIYDDIDDEYVPTKTEIKEAKQNSVNTSNMSFIQYKGYDYYVDDTNDGRVYVAVPVGDDDYIIGKEVGMFDMNEGRIKLYKDTKTNFNPIFG
jgi:hypothetical protein